MTKKARLIALEAGNKRYLMTKPCKRGHLGERYASCGLCCQCVEDHQRKKKIEVQAAIKLHNTKLFEPARVYSVVVRHEHREAYDDLSHVAAYGTDEQVAQCAAFLGMIRAQVITHDIARPEGELNRAELAALVDLAPTRICYIDGSPLVERYNERDELHILIADRWYIATQLADVWKGTRAAVRPVRLP